MARRAGGAATRLRTAVVVMAEQLQIGLDPRLLARSTDPGTSHAAARGAELATHRGIVLRALWAASCGVGHPLSTRELADLDVLDLDRHEIARRAADLLTLGLLARLDETDGRHRPGHRLAVTAAGLRVLHGIES